MNRVGDYVLFMVPESPLVSVISLWLAERWGDGPYDINYRLYYAPIEDEV